MKTEMTMKARFLVSPLVPMKPPIPGKRFSEQHLVTPFLSMSRRTRRHNGLPHGLFGSSVSHVFVTSGSLFHDGFGLAGITYI
jgi:hypothetical protein